MLQVRVICPPDLTDAVVERLRTDVGAVSLTLQRGAGVTPEGDLVVCDLARERINNVLRELRYLGMEERGRDLDRHHRRLADAPGAADRARRARSRGRCAAVGRHRGHSSCRLRAVGVIPRADGAGGGDRSSGDCRRLGGADHRSDDRRPEYGPLQAIAVGLHRGRRYWRSAAVLLLGGLGVAVLAAAVTGLIVRFVTGSDSSLDPANRFFTSFVTEPNGYSAVVAFAAGIAGTVALARMQATALAGVLVSVTTIPAAAAMGVDASTGNWSDLAGAAIQLGINLVSLLAAGLATLAVYDRWVPHVPARRPTRPSA